MAYSVSSDWIDEIEGAACQPIRTLTIGNSDYTDYVLKWPVISRKINDIKSVDVTIEISNTSGHLNDFYAQTYSMVNSVQIKFGFDIGGEELVEIYNGQLKGIKYDGVKATIHCKDRLWALADRKVGESDNPVTFSSVIPSGIAWDLCTCYGGFSNIESTSNPDIDYQSFLDWASQCSGDSLLMSAEYDGQKVNELLKTLAEFTDTAVWINAQGKLKFERLMEASSQDLVFSTSDFLGFAIDVDSLRLINRQHVEALYSTESDYWQIAVYDESSVSVDSYGLHEDVLRDDHIWYVSSTNALNFAQRRIMKLDQPPVKYEIETGLKSVQMEINDTLRMVDDFFDIDSSDAWRITEFKFNMQPGTVNMVLDSAMALQGFYLDYDYLDGPKYLL